MSNLNDAAAAIVNDADASEGKAGPYDITEAWRAADDDNAIVARALEHTKPWQVRRKEAASPSAQIVQAAEAAVPKQTIAGWVRELPPEVRVKISEAITAQEYAEMEADGAYQAVDNDGEPVEDPAFDPWYQG